MALTDVALCSRALIRIGAAPITSFNDGTAESEIAGALYDNTRDALLSSYPWTFASGQLALTQLSTDPVADYSFAFQLPTDYLRAVSAGTGTKGRGLNYRIAEQEYERARQIDAQQDTPNKIENFSLIDVRD